MQAQIKVNPTIILTLNIKETQWLSDYLQNPGVTENTSIDEDNTNKIMREKFFNMLKATLTRHQLVTNTIT